jgi:ParB-like chromosome segregation protein Spo0J
VGEDGGLIAGHARVLAARQLGIAKIPVMVAAGCPRARDDRKSKAVAGR